MDAPRTDRGLSQTFTSTPTSVVSGVTAWAPLSSQAITVHANKLFSPNEQDFVMLTPVPEPSTYALMFGGLVGIGCFARRRTSRD